MKASSVMITVVYDNFNAKISAKDFYRELL